MFKKSIAFLVVAAALGMASRAGADPIVLGLEVPSSIIVQQTTQNPCIFGGPSCQSPAGWDFVLFPNGGNISSYNSTTDLTDANDPQNPYTVAQILGVTGGLTTFDIGIDNNTAGGQAPETLLLFQMFVNGTLIAYYDGGTGTVLDATNNGTGFSDNLLTGFSLLGFLPTDLVTFHVEIGSATNGVENLFIIGREGSVVGPEPASMVLLGLGMFGAAAAARRRRPVKS